MEYSSPQLVDIGSIATLTLGHGGSSLDGGSLSTQRGQGNDGTGPHLKRD